MKKRRKEKQKVAALIVGAGALLIAGLYILSRTSLQPEPEYKLRTFDAASEEEYVALLTKVPESELVPFRCTIPFINNGEGDFYWRLSYQHDLFDEVQDAVFLKAIESIRKEVPEARTLLSGRFCETESGRIFLDYYTAAREKTINENGYYHGHDVEGFLTEVDEQGMPGTPAPFIQKEFWTYTGCKPIFQITKNDELYLSCGVTQTYSAESILLQIDLQNGSVTPLYQCDYDRMSEYTKSCTEITAT